MNLRQAFKSSGRNIRSNKLLFLSILCLKLSALYYAVVTLSTPSVDSCIDTLYPFSLGKGSIEYKWDNFRHYYVPQAIYRGGPSPEREAAWDSLTPFGMVQVDKDVAISHHGGENPHWMYRADHETDGVLAVPGIVLYMNCLKIIRRGVYMESNHTVSATAPPEQLDSCIEILRQELMCKCDMTPYLMAISRHSKGGTSPVVGNRHFCRVYEKIIKWANQRFIPGRRDITQIL